MLTLLNDLGISMGVERIDILSYLVFRPNPGEKCALAAIRAAAVEEIRVLIRLL